MELSKKATLQLGEGGLYNQIKKKTKQTLNECLSEKTVAQVTAMNQSI